MIKLLKCPAPLFRGGGGGGGGVHIFSGGGLSSI